MHLSTNKEVTSLQRETASPNIGDYAAGILQGNEESYSKYLSLKTFDRNQQPAWLNAKCFQLAESRFQEIPFAKTIEQLMYTVSIKHLSNPVNSWIHRNLLLKNPDSVREQWFKGIKDIHKASAPRFTDQHYSQIGVPEVGILNDLLELSPVEHVAQPPSDLLSQMKSVAASSKLNERKIEEFLGSIISFTPGVNNPFGVAASKAYFDIGEAIIQYSVLSDILEGSDIVLPERKFCELYNHLAGIPFVQWQEEPVIQALFTYAHALNFNPTLMENISRKDVFSRFAMSGRPLSDLTSEVQRIAERTAVTLRPSHVPVPKDDEQITISRLDQMLNSIENLFEEWEVEAVSEELAPLRLARLAVSHGVPFAKLERLLFLHEFDGQKVIEALRPEGKAALIEPSPTATQDRLAQLVVGIEPEVTSLSLFMHREGEKEPFTTWYGELQKSQKHRVDAALHKFAEGHFGNVKKLSTRAKSEADVSAYEVKIKDSGMRIYFRYLPNQRVILLGGGDKSSQDRDIPLMMDRAALYNGNNNPLSDGLREWEDSKS